MTKELDPIDHGAQSKTNLLTQYKVSELFGVLIETLSERVNDIEGQVDLFKSTLQLETAAGVNLNLIGDIVNAKPRVVDDDEYRKNIKALIVAFNSHGTAADIIEIFRQFLPDDATTIIDINPASFSITMKDPGGVTDPVFLVKAVRIAKAAGVQFEGLTVIEFLPVFSFEEDTDVDGGPFAVIGGDPGSFYSQLFI